MQCVGGAAMTHPITPPPELVAQWSTAALGVEDWLGGYNLELIATQAARWGADQELEACCVLMDEWGLDGEDLMQCRRPKLPSLRTQAYDALDTYIYGEPDPKDKERTYNAIRRALEALPND